MVTSKRGTREYSFVAKADPESGGWVIFFPDLPGCMTQAETFHEIGDMARDAMETWIEDQVADGLPVPEPGDIPIPEWTWESAGMPTFSTRDVAERLAVTPRRILAIARNRKVGTRLGRSIMFREGDIERLRPGRPGRPRKSAH